MFRFTLKEIAKACGGELHTVSEEAKEACIQSLVTDSRQAGQGAAFLAIEGARVDGHNFIGKVFGQGALVAITTKTPAQVSDKTGEDCSHWGNYILVEDTLVALKQIAEAYREKIPFPIVGITGSVGKTSTKEFIAGVLSEKYSVAKTEGNFNNEIGVPLTLFRIGEQHEVAVVEMGISDFGEMHRLSKMVKPDICVITNIGQCHLENLKTRDGILRAKSEIFDFMAKNGEICLNGDDDKLCTVTDVKGHKPHFFGFGENPCEEVQVLECESHGLMGSDAVLRLANGERLSITTTMPGRHMIMNAAAAATVANLLGLTGEEIARGVEKVKPITGRNNFIKTKDALLIDDCYNANPASMRSAIDLLKLADTCKVAILGDMLELGENSDTLHAEIGTYAVEAGMDVILCAGPNAIHMYHAATEAKKNTGSDVSVYYFEDQPDLLTKLQKNREAYLPVGSTVLLKASHGMNFNAVLEFLNTVPGN